MRLPGLIDVHVHMREPGGEHKEDWASGTAAALAGGFTAVLAMPNTRPPVVDEESFVQARAAARARARCDHAQYVGATSDNASALAPLAEQAAGLKIYLDPSYGPLRVDRLGPLHQHFAAWPGGRPIAVHAEGAAVATAVGLAAATGRPLHLCHVSRREEIALVRAAKERGLPVTCEVTPHNLFLSERDARAIGRGLCEVRPPLATPADCAALWDNLDVIDCFATDHAPHTYAEKTGAQPPPGFPGLETALPLLLNAVREGRLGLEDLVARLHHNPRRIFGLPLPPDTFVDVDLAAAVELGSEPLQTRAGWTPFAGLKVRGRVRRVVVRGREAFRDGEILALPGSGRDLRDAAASRG
ncbi:MAG: amidohydrolase family protein [Deltaproteobacteria bacterium]|nr:amidohydrolase family protein [Deltaproteobacteria bacterium]